MSLVYGLGLIPDDVLPSDPQYGAALDGPYPESAWLHAPLIPGLDQDAGNSCVGFAFMQAFYAITRKQLSANALYYAARLIGGGETSHDGRMLRDDGCKPRDAWAALIRHGFPLEERCPSEFATLNDPPDWDVWQAASDENWARGRRILSNRTNSIRHAICNQEPVVLGIAVDQPLLDSRGELWTFRGPLLGWHMVCAIGYDHDGVRIVNSWGDGWGDHGTGVLSWEQIESEWTSNIAVPEVRL